MILLFDILILLSLVVCAFVTLSLKDLVSATVTMSIFSFLLCLLWAEMGAVDVSFTEAAVGAGVGTIFLIATIFNTTRRSSD
jgi:energy-converting hydrogenase B subunit D